MNLPPVFVVSLARAVERREWMREQLKQKGIRAEMLDAVDGNNLDLSQYRNRLNTEHWRVLRGRELNRGEIGCFLSHYQLWESLAANKTECALVLEDDTMLDENFAEVAAAAANVNWRWDVILLSSRKRYKVDRVLCELPHGRRLVRYDKRVGTTRAYLITLGGAQKLLGICRDISAPIDWRYAEWWVNGLEFYAVDPAVTVSKHTPSLIEKPRRVKRSVGEQMLAAMARYHEWQGRQLCRRMRLPRKKDGGDE